MKQMIALLTAAFLAAPALAGPLTGTFDSIDGGTLSVEDWRGSPVLVVNTASRCAFTKQYDELQALQDRYGDRGLVVLAVPSDDFRQELDSDAEVKEFCELTYGLTLPMTTISHVRGPQAHPFYKALSAEGFVPSWNFSKALIGPDGTLVASWGPVEPPSSPEITGRIEALLAGG